MAIIARLRVAEQGFLLSNPAILVCLLLTVLIPLYPTSASARDFDPSKISAWLCRAVTGANPEDEFKSFPSMVLGVKPEHEKFYQVEVHRKYQEKKVSTSTTFSADIRNSNFLKDPPIGRLRYHYMNWRSGPNGANLLSIQTQGPPRDMIFSSDQEATRWLSSLGTVTRRYDEVSEHNVLVAVDRKDEQDYGWEVTVDMFTQEITVHWSGPEDNMGQRFCK